MHLLFWIILLLREHMGRPKKFNREGVLDRAIPVFWNTASRTRQFSTWKRRPASTSRACIRSSKIRRTSFLPVLSATPKLVVHKY